MDDKNKKKALINKGLVEECGVEGNLFYILDLLTHLFDKNLKLYA